MEYRWIKRTYSVAEFFLVSVDKDLTNDQVIELFENDTDAPYMDPHFDKISNSETFVDKPPSERELQQFYKHAINLDIEE